MTDPTPTPLPAAPDWRALCKELRDAYQRSEFCPGDPAYFPFTDSLINRADAALATPPAATREAGPLPQAGAQPTSDEIESCFRAWWSDQFGSAYFGAIPLVACIEWTQIALARWGGAALPVPAADKGEDDLSPCREFALRLYRLLEQFDAELFYTNADDGVHFEINTRKPSAGFSTRAELRDLLVDAGLLSAADKGEVQP
jgi:hypothetical protein